MTPDQSLADHPWWLRPFGVNAAPECHLWLRFPMVIMHRADHKARVPRTCLTNAITSR